MEFDIFFDEVHGFGVGSEDTIGTTTWDADDVPLLNVFDSVFKVNVSLDGDSLSRLDGGLCGGNGDVEGFGLCLFVLDRLEASNEKH